ncbi:peptidoglycan-associated lipoprotein Pal [Zoogloea sp.]|uniref:peptidoglycan-associated lipoprotein Pal n=1 Tax=Zoogloea sp. TaxID=49181 RepID=UPI002C38401B|nr:peptidoglycan-associated lipoprotein Pal [Zoogloea sp.]HQA10017.1 peptidoglycan-associated lipoprotein Pal [Zoogloea sp.]
MKKSVLLTLLCATALAACSTTATKTADTGDQSAAVKAASASVASDKMSAAEMEARKLEAERAELAKKSVYFGFDQYAVDAKYRDVVKQHSDFIAAHATDTVMIQGNADERGSREYNLALGQKRAEAVRKALTLLGVADSRLEAVSFGSEKPRETCHEERCWAENRRVDLQHKDK